VLRVAASALLVKETMTGDELQAIVAKVEP
jgi:hypothetical protein